MLIFGAAGWAAIRGWKAGTSVHVKIVPVAGSGSGAAGQGGDAVDGTRAGLFPHGEGAAVVIDVLRATTTLVTALAHGAERVYPVASPAEAHKLRVELSPHPVVLAGERDSVRLPGFDLGNSPRDCTVAAVAGRYVVMSTTNGTAAMLALRPARVGVAAALVNLPAVAAALAGEETVTILCAGTKGSVSLEDTIAAGGLINHWQSNGQPVVTDDFGLVALAAYRAARTDLAGWLSRSQNGRRLLELGWPDDLDWCAGIGAFDIVPVLRHDERGNLYFGLV